MCRHNGRAKASHEEVASPDENLLMFSKPVRLYNILLRRSRFNPSFLRRCLNYKIRAKGKTKSGSGGKVVFNYKDCNNTLQKTEIRENCSCPFCYMLCGNFKGLQHHLNAFHDLFEFECMHSGEEQTVNVSVRLDRFESEDEEIQDDKFAVLSFCSRPRKRKLRGGSGGNISKRLRICILPLDSPSLANATENGIALLNNGNAEATDLAGQVGMNPPGVAQSSLDSDANAMLPSEAVVPAAKTRKLSAERSEARSNQLLLKRQFYHSHKVQPMSIEQVMCDGDSEDEVDDDVADFEDRQMLDDFVDVNKDEKRFMHLWNAFVRKQRVVADGHVPWACEAFSKFHKKELNHSTPLFWCWRSHLIKLWNLGLLDAVTMNNCALILENSDDNTDNTSVDHQSDNNNSNNNVDHGIDLNTDDRMDVDEDVNDRKDK